MLLMKVTVGPLFGPLRLFVKLDNLMQKKKNEARSLSA